jgi:DNA repair protein RadA/Sms
MEAKKMGFNRCVVPKGSLKRLPRTTDITLEGVDTVVKAMDVLF